MDLTNEEVYRFARSLGEKIPAFRTFESNLRKARRVMEKKMPILDGMFRLRGKHLAAQGFYVPDRYLEEEEVKEAPAPLTQAELYDRIWEALQKMTPQALKKVAGITHQQLEAVKASIAA